MIPLHLVEGLARHAVTSSLRRRLQLAGLPPTVEVELTRMLDRMSGLDLSRLIASLVQIAVQHAAAREGLIEDVIHRASVAVGAELSPLSVRWLRDVVTAQASKE